jgi:ankyrin repeat protein
METVNQTGVADVTTRKAYAQMFLSKRLLQRDIMGEGALAKALAAGKYVHMAKLTSLLRNDELAYNAMVRGESVRKPVAIDKSSLAPTNPLLSLLLQPDIDGNTIFHWATARGDLQALKRLLAGVASNDLYAIITALPNTAGVTLYQMVSDPEAAKRRIITAAMNKTVVAARAKLMVDGISTPDGDVRDFLVARATEVLDLAKSVGRNGPMPPSFRLPRRAEPETRAS